MSIAATATIHKTAIIEDGAIVGENVNIGPFCHIGSTVRIGANSRLMSHVVMEGVTELGESSTVFHHAVLGAAPQDGKHKGTPTRLVIGSNCMIREGVTMHTGSDASSGLTSVGDNCTFLAYSHVSHDSKLGNRITFANNVMIGGHVTIGDNVIIGGGAAVHQFCRIGHHAFVGGMAALAHDLIPFGSAIGNHAYLAGLNIIGMKRSGMSRADIHALRHAVKMLFNRKQPIRENAVDVEATYGNSPVIRDLIEFMDFGSKRSFCTPPLDSNGGAETADGDD